MQCPRCQQKVALHINQCPNCNRMLKPLIMSQHIALSTQQHQGLRQHIVTLLVALLFLIGIIVTFHVALKEVSALIWPIIGLMIAVVGFYLVQLVRDWISGQVLVQIDQLQTLQEVRRRGGRRFYGDFSAIGSQQLQERHYERAIEGNYYLVTYSQHSKIVWELALVTRKIAYLRLLSRTINWVGMVVTTGGI